MRVGFAHGGVLGRGDEQRVTGGVQHGVLGVAQVDVPLAGQVLIQNKLAILHAQGHKRAAVVDLQHRVAVGGAGQRCYPKIALAALDAKFNVIHLLPRRVDQVGAGHVQRVKVNTERQAVVHRQAANHLAGIFGAVERLQRAELGGVGEHLAVADFAVGGQGGEVLIADGSSFVQSGFAVSNGVPPGKALAVAQRENLPGDIAVVGVGILHFVGEIDLIVIAGTGAIHVSRHFGVGAYRDRLVERHVPQGHAENAAANVNLGHNAEIGCGALHLIGVLVGVHALGVGVYFVACFRRYSVQSLDACTPGAVVVHIVVQVRVEREAGVEVAVVQVPVGVRGVKVALAAHREAAQGGGVAC